MSETELVKYPLLAEILRLRDLHFQPMYSTRDIAAIFDVSIRTIQHRIATGSLAPRNLPGRAKFLAQDLEDFLRASRDSDGALKQR